MKGSKGYEKQNTGGYTAPKYSAEGKPVVKHGGRGVMADGKVTQTSQKYPLASTRK